MTKGIDRSRRTTSLRWYRLALRNLIAAANFVTSRFRRISSKLRFAAAETSIASSTSQFVDMSDAEKQQLREEIAQEKFDKSFEELDSDEVSWLAVSDSSWKGPQQQEDCYPPAAEGTLRMSLAYTCTVTVLELTLNAASAV